MRNADFVDNIPKGMALDVNSISIKRMGYHDERSKDVTKDFWESNRIKADTKHRNKFWRHKI